MKTWFILIPAAIAAVTLSSCCLGHKVSHESASNCGKCCKIPVQCEKCCSGKAKCSSCKDCSPGK